MSDTDTDTEVAQEERTSPADDASLGSECSDREGVPDVVAPHEVTTLEDAGGALATRHRVECIRIMDNIIDGDVSELSQFVKAAFDYMQEGLDPTSRNATILALSSRAAYLVRHAIARGQREQIAPPEATALRGGVVYALGALSCLGPARGVWAGLAARVLGVAPSLDTTLNLSLALLALTHMLDRASVPHTCALACEFVIGATARLDVACAAFAVRACVEGELDVYTAFAVVGGLLLKKVGLA